MASTKLTKAVFSHVNEYLYEILYDEIKDHAVSIGSASELNTYLTKGMIGEYRVSAMTAHKDVMGFYKAMLKVCKWLMANGPEGYRDDPSCHGTEDRGWYRVYGAIVLKDGYFCSMDLGRDQWMAETLLAAEAITDQQYAAYKTSMTLKMMNNERWKTNDFPDVKKIRDYWQPQAQEKVLDMRLIRMLEAA